MGALPPLSFACLGLHVLVSSVRDFKLGVSKSAVDVGDTLGGGTFVKIVHGCACRMSKIQFFHPITHPSIYHFQYKSTHFAQIGCFLQ